MKAAPEVSLVVDACHLEGRHDKLEAMLTQLEMCEKALQVQRPAQMSNLTWQSVAAFQQVELSISKFRPLQTTRSRSALPGRYSLADRPAND